VVTLLSLGLSNAVLATALALVVAVLAWLVRHRPALVHGLWLLVLLRFLLPPLWSLPLPDLAPSPALPADESQPAEPELVLPVPPTSPTHHADDTAPAVAVPEHEPVAASELVPEGQADWREPVWPLVAGVWLAGAAGWWLLAGVRLARFHRQLRVAWRAPADIQERAVRLAAGLGLRRCPEVWMVPAILSPLLAALGPRPRLLLPVTLWQRLSAQQQDTILAHELAHLRRKDHWVRRLELLVLGLYWWHPVAWWAQRRLHEAEEECCDDWVVTVLPESAGAYASTLVETLAYLSGRRAVVPMSASGLGQVDSLKRRLTMILGNDRPRTLPRWSMALLGAALLLIPLLPGWAEPPQSAGQSTTDEELVGPPSRNPPPYANTFTAFSRRSREGAADASAQDLKDQVEILQVQLTHAEAVLKSKKAHLDYRQRQSARIQELAKRGAVEERIVDEEETRKLAAESELEAARAAVDELKTRLRIAKRRLGQQDGQDRQSAQEALDTVKTEEAQVRVKEAELKAAEAACASAQKTYERAKALRERNVINDSSVDEMHDTFESCQAAVEVKKADLLVQKVRLKQVLRRVQHLIPKMPGSQPAGGAKVTEKPLPPLPGGNKPTTASNVPAPHAPRVIERGTMPSPPQEQSQAERMQSLEKKLNEIADELRALRRELDSQKKSGSNTPSRTNPDR
jgi:beta-lactamase regulating signal transducer with metallopeptidase domain